MGASRRRVSNLKPQPRAQLADPERAALRAGCSIGIARTGATCPGAARAIRTPIWISEAMLQQTRVETVIPYWERFLARFPDVAALAAADLDDVLGAWAGLGYYSRARNLHRAAQLVVERHGGRAARRPRRRLRELPGVGRYTAGAVASIAFDRPEPMVDGNVARVLARLLGIRRRRAQPRGRRTASGARRSSSRAAEARRPEPGAHGARRARLHAARAALPRLPAAPPLRRARAGATPRRCP